MALYSGLVPEAARPLALERLLEDIRDKHKGIYPPGSSAPSSCSTCFPTTAARQVAYDIANQPDFPGWGWMLENGATTLWEHWAGSDNTFSNNHPMFGSVSQWFFNCPGGIRPADDAVGFDKILIAPQVLGDLQWVKAGYQSVRGPVTCEWKKTDGKLEIQVAVPVGATATVWVPAKDAAGVTEGGKPAARGRGREIPAHGARRRGFRGGGGKLWFCQPPIRNEDVSSAKECNVAAVCDRRSRKCGAFSWRSMWHRHSSSAATRPPMGIARVNVYPRQPHPALQASRPCASRSSCSPVFPWYFCVRRTSRSSIRKATPSSRNSPKPRLKGLTLTDYHIHIRGGMTLEKAVLRQEQSGIRSAVLENFGREWPLPTTPSSRTLSTPMRRPLS